jgi:hypothetical protein
MCHHGWYEWEQRRQPSLDHGAQGQAEREFWQRQGSTAIFAAAWEMVVEAYRWKKKSDSELALQRTVERLEQRRR